MTPDQIWNHAEKSAKNLVKVKEHFEPIVGRELSFGELLYLDEELKKNGLAVVSKPSHGVEG